MTAALITISVITAILAGFSKAVCDLSEEGKLKFHKKSFWLKDISSNNKYKNGDPKQGAKFWQSTNALVMFTDAWHLFGFFERVTYAISFIIVGFLAGFVSLYYLFGALINYIIFIGIFHIFHTYKILRK